MTAALSVLLAIIGSAGLYTFIQFLITRKDNRDDKLDKICDRIDEIDTNVKQLAELEQENYDRLKEDMLQNQALVARVRILRASDEILHNMRHSKEWFDQLNDDISFYEKYCKEHPQFVNNKAMHAVANINKIYSKALEKNDFL